MDPCYPKLKFISLVNLSLPMNPAYCNKYESFFKGGEFPELECLELECLAAAAESKKHKELGKLLGSLRDGSASTNSVKRFKSNGYPSALKLDFNEPKLQALHIGVLRRFAKGKESAWKKKKAAESPRFLNIQVENPPCNLNKITVDNCPQLALIKGLSGWRRTDKVNAVDSNEVARQLTNFDISFSCKDLKFVSLGFPYDDVTSSRIYQSYYGTTSDGITFVKCFTSSTGKAEGSTPTAFFKKYVEDVVIPLGLDNYTKQSDRAQFLKDAAESEKCLGNLFFPYGYDNIDKAGVKAAAVSLEE